MRRYVCLLALVLTAACGGAKITPATPKAAAAIKADAVIIRVSEVEAALGDFCGPAPQCAPGTIDTNTFRDVIKALVGVVSTARKAPDGWQATVKAAWAQSKGALAGITNPAVRAAISALDALLGAL